jgi:hypothetical protein
MGCDCQGHPSWFGIQLNRVIDLAHHDRRLRGLLGDTAPLTGTFDLGLALDGSSILATANPGVATGVIQRLDPAALTTIQSFSGALSFHPASDNVGFGITTTNDGRSWLGLGEPAYVTPQSLTPVMVNEPINTPVSDGPWFAGSRDGERLIIVLGSDVSPAPPMFYLNSADGILRQNPAGLTFYYQLSVSETGDRLLLGGQTLLDGSFNTVGQATPSQGYFQINGLVSPDGSRVFLLSVPNSIANIATTPRVFVFDATAPATSLPLLGYFDVPDTFSCDVQVNGNCSWLARGAISIDGQTLFYNIGTSLYVVPVPTTLSQALAPPGVVRSQRRAVPVPWPVKVH